MAVPCPRLHPFTLDCIWGGGGTLLLSTPGQAALSVSLGGTSSPKDRPCSSPRWGPRLYIRLGSTRVLGTALCPEQGREPAGMCLAKGAVIQELRGMWELPVFPPASIFPIVILGSESWGAQQGPSTCCLLCSVLNWCGSVPTPAWHPCCPPACLFHHCIEVGQAALTCGEGGGKKQEKQQGDIESRPISS